MAKQSQPEFKADLPETGYVRLTHLLKFIPFSRATIWRKVKNGGVSQARKAVRACYRLAG